MIAAKPMGIPSAHTPPTFSCLQAMIKNCRVGAARFKMVTPTIARDSERVADVERLWTEGVTHAG